MKWFLTFFAAFLGMVSPCWSNVGGEIGVNWLTNYEDAVKLSKAQGKPLLLFFTGTGWCPACARLEQEVFDTQVFADMTGDKYIFIKLDFPQDKNLIDGFTAAQNKQLLKKFDVRSFPTVLLLDSKNQIQIGITGYRPGGPRQYAAHLYQMVNDFLNYSQKMQKMNGQHLSGSEIKGLYDKARELDLANDIQSLLKAGINSDQKEYFLLERYRWLAEEGMINEKEAAAIKQQLLALDSANKQKIYYEMAVIAFEAHAEGKDNWSPEEIVAPLVDYAEKFGLQDKENLWRLDMIIAQVYLNKNKLAEALKYAKGSYQNAPDKMKSDIAAAVKSIEFQIAQVK